MLPLLLYISLPPGALPLIGVSLGFGVFLTALIYMLGTALSNPQVNAFAKEEFAALIFSLFIILFWLGADGFLNALTTGLLQASVGQEYATASASSGGLGGATSGFTSSHLQLAIGSMEVFYQKLKSAYISLYLFEALIGFLSTVSFPLFNPVPAVNVISLSVAPFTGLGLLSNAHTIVVEAISYLITVVWAKEFILLFARDCVPLFLLPMGLIMRAFPFFRSTGSSILALCFALYFVFPYAVILSNYLIFDIYQPADFSYTPVQAGLFGTTRSQDDVNEMLGDARGEESDPLFEMYSGDSLAESGSTQQACDGNDVVQMLCSTTNIIRNTWDAALEFFKTLYHIWSFMMGLSGDFMITFFTNPATPESVSAGLYFFIIEEVNLLSPFVILMTITTILEIIFTVTMYRNISLLIGGEAELVGLTKVI